jgi:hypothetical protein
MTTSDVCSKAGGGGSLDRFDIFVWCRRSHMSPSSAINRRIKLIKAMKPIKSPPKPSSFFITVSNPMMTPIPAIGTPIKAITRRLNDDSGIRLTPSSFFPATLAPQWLQKLRPGFTDFPQDEQNMAIKELYDISMLKVQRNLAPTALQHADRIGYGLKSREPRSIGIFERNKRHQPILHKLFTSVLA